MRIASKTAEQRASAAAMKERRAQDAAQAMRDYQANRVATLAKTARLRALRLAKEAEAGNSAPRKTRSPKNAE
jgi:aspartate/methionine/tyrosine aminotransferase